MNEFVDQAFCESESLRLAKSLTLKSDHGARKELPIF